MRRHSAIEITSMVQRAEELVASGRSQIEACKTLGVSVMTFHRWRKREAARNFQATDAVSTRVVGFPVVKHFNLYSSREINALRLENSRLRRIATDLSLDKIRIEEELALFDRAPLMRSSAHG